MYFVQYASITQATDCLICLWCNMMDFSNMIDCRQHYCLYLSIYKENFIYRCMNCTVQRYYLVLYEKGWPNFYTLTKMSMKRCSIYNTHIKGKSFLQVNIEQVALRKINNLYSKHALINAFGITVNGCYLLYSGITWYMHRINWKEKYVQPIFFNVQYEKTTLFLICNELHGN